MRMAPATRDPLRTIEWSTGLCRGLWASKKKKKTMTRVRLNQSTNLIRGEAAYRIHPKPPSLQIKIQPRRGRPLRIKLNRPRKSNKLNL